MRLVIARALLALLALGGVTAGVAVVVQSPELSAAPATVRPRRSIGRAEPPATLDSIADAVTRASPFRVRRAAADVAYDPQRVGEATAPAPDAPPKPVLDLVGIVWGRDPTAVIAGVPGAARAWVVERGDTMAGLRVRQVGRERVVVTGYDTTWNLRVRELP